MENELADRTDAMLEEMEKRAEARSEEKYNQTLSEITKPGAPYRKHLLRLLGSSLLLCLIFALPGRADKQPNRNESPKSLIVQSVEIIYAEQCIKAITPVRGFVLHVPLKENGDADEKHIYWTGKIQYALTDPRCGEMKITRKEVK
jgi:hypothetical protein